MSAFLGKHLGLIIAAAIALIPTLFLTGAIFKVLFRILKELTAGLLACLGIFARPLRYLGQAIFRELGLLHRYTRPLARRLSLGCLVLFGLGGATLYTALAGGRATPAGPPSFARLSHDDDDDASRADPAPVHFTIQLGALSERLGTLPRDDQPDQLADWAVLGTLMYAGLPAEQLRDITFDKTPFRLPSLEEVYNFDYGPGRRVVLPGSRSWLFYADSDPHPVATLARLADQVRVEQDAIPRSFTMFRYRFELASATVEVDVGPTVRGAELFGPRYGYFEATVGSAAELSQFLAKIDDVSHVRQVGSGLLLGGRAFADARTQSVELADVAALYQAHHKIYRHNTEVLRRGRTDEDLVLDRFNDLIKEYNLQVEAATQSLDVRRAQLIDQGASSHAFLVSLDSLARLLSRYNLGLRPLLGSIASPQQDDAAPGESPILSLQQQRQIIDQLRPYLQRLQLTISAKLPPEQRERKGRVKDQLMPGSPGFSLDPQWDVAGLRRDLELLVKKPQELLAQAAALLKDSQAVGYDESATPTEVWAARELLDSGSLPLLPSRLAPLLRQLGGTVSLDRLRSFVRAREQLAQVKDLAAHRRVLQPLLVPLGLPKPASGSDERTWPLEELIAQLSAEDAKGPTTLLPALRYLRARNERQCARYDGPMQGTQIGMTLFYTDLMAKIWEGVDYYRSAPVSAVPGILSQPSVPLEWQYLDEQRRLPATRIWFGTRPGSYRLASTEDGFDFSHIATRVYSAGSNPLHPGAETLPAEPSRRAISWWDRHYYKIADYEQQYHRQNQIMKWSVITGWLQQHARTLGPELYRVQVDHSQRFDRWFKSQPGLRFRRDVRLLPESRWLGSTECLEQLHSYPFSREDGWHYMEGGVSLAGAEEWHAARLGPEVEPTLRRIGLADEGSNRRVLKFIKGTQAEMLPGESANSAAARLQVGANARLRGSGSQLQLADLHTGISRADHQIVMAVKLPGQGQLLSLKGELTPSRVVLQLEGLDSELALMAKLNQKSAVTPEGLAAQADFAPGQGRYIVQSGDQVEVLSLGRGDAAAGEQPALRFTTEPPGNAPVLAQSGRPKGLLARLRDHSEATEKLFAMSLKREEATAQLNRARYQVLDAQATGAQQGGVAQYFTDRPPPAGARPLRLSTGDSALPEIEAHLIGDRLILERPGTTDGRAQQVFNEFAERVQLSAGDLATLAREAARRGPTAAIPVGRLLRAGRREGRVAIALADGNAQPLFETMESASGNGELADTARQLVAELDAQALADLQWGRQTPARQLLAPQPELGGARAGGEAGESSALLSDAAALRRRGQAALSGPVSYGEPGTFRRAARLPSVEAVSPQAAPELLQRLRDGSVRVFIEQPLLAELPTDGRILEGVESAYRAGHLNLGRLPESFSVQGDISVLELSEGQQTRRFVAAPADAAAGRSGSPNQNILLLRAVGGAVSPDGCRAVSDPVELQQCRAKRSAARQGT